MFILENEKQLANAVAKARKVRTKVKFIAFGKYAVSGSNGNFYTVICAKNPLGQKEVACECQGAEKGLVCYHAVSALSLHIGLARQRQTVK